VTDHKNLEYFATTKLLSQRQARWSEYLSAFNMVIRFQPGSLGTKPDTLTHRPDLYPSGGKGGYGKVNPHNLKPIFSSKQLSTSLRATSFLPAILRGIIAMDLTQLNTEILSALDTDPTAKSYLTDTNDPKYKNWSKDELGYCRSCTTCSRSKSKHHKPYGLLRQLPVPVHPWDSISMDFIKQLPTSSDGFTAILVVVDRFTKQSIFILTHDTITSAQLAELFIIHVFSKHGVPCHVTSNWGSEFVSHFFRSLGKALDMKLHFTSGYHPEGDGETERVKTFEETIREVSRSVQHHSPGRTFVLDSPLTRQYASCSSRLSCIYARAFHSKHHSGSSPNPSATSHGGW